MKIAFAKPQVPTGGALVVGVLDGRTLTPSAARLDGDTGGMLTRAMAASRFEGKKDQALAVLAPQGVEAGRVLLLGLGKAEALDPLAAQAFGGAAIAQLAGSGEAQAWLAVDEIGFGAVQFAANAAFGALLRGYRFDKYLTREKKEEKPSLDTVTLLVDDPAAAEAAFAPLARIAEGVFLTRDAVSEPANVITPETLAAEARKLGDIGIDVEVLDEAEMRRLGMGALLGVGQGSERESQLVVMRWSGANDRDAAPLALVGKGVTFDSGGISIKPGAGMEEMKWDMAGAGAVIGAMRALAGRRAAANVVGVVGLVENMPSGKAQRPGDVVTSMSGQTIEVINTDAEGRLVLADALHYTRERFKPRAMVDLATLTGAIVIALGNEFAGLFASDDSLAADLAAAGNAVGEKVWRMPLAEPYDKQIKSDIADMKNSGGRAAGSITAGWFLREFAEGYPWAHVDIAGTAYTDRELPTQVKGPTGVMVRLFAEFLLARS